METIPDFVWWWTGGIVDGDGCVTVRGGCTLRVSVTQAARGNIVVLILHALFGGVTDVLKAKKSSHQDTHRWILEGEKAVIFVAKLCHHLFLKKSQLQLAATFPTQNGNVCVITHNTSGEVLEFHTMKECSLHFGLSKNVVANWQKGYRGMGKPHIMRDWTFEIRTQKEAMQKKKDIDERLRVLKTLEHDAIQETPPAPYFAGVFDAEGTVIVYQIQSLKTSVPQLHTAILDSLQRSYGGSISWRCHTYKWTCMKNCRQLFSDLEPYLIAKLPQVRLALRMQKGEVSEVNAVLKTLKGHQNNYTADQVAANLQDALHKTTLYGNNQILSFVCSRCNVEI